ncbi:hypothetical protein BDV23DRAFT_170043 [Aspergillus alliaceus]|uniref:Uncharacterized protein n=1 Tax=Petromyces alliaceus TaxID=209559 RepID=A0A5N7CHG9_PETAA|nr:hypothetical protein BDV23DRAFT_170043 [Aspergillus alliaceus]
MDAIHPSSTQNIDWSRFASVQYAMSTDYLCNSVMIFEALMHLKSKAGRLLMYSEEISVTGSFTQSRSLRKVRDEYGVKLMPMQMEFKILPKTWAFSYMKPLAFHQTQYDRHMDELFLLPPYPIAIPRAYRLNTSDIKLCTRVMLVQPSEFEFHRILRSIDAGGPPEYAMEVMNILYKRNALVLPHRFTLSVYMVSSLESWDPDRVLSEAKYLHFSDWPVFKPWIETPAEMMEAEQPACDRPYQRQTCHAHELWLGF